MSDELLQQWVDNWRQAARILERQKADELQNLDAREAIRRILPMCDWCFEHSQPRTTSGLLEQQRYFALARERKP